MQSEILATNDFAEMFSLMDRLPKGISDTKRLFDLEKKKYRISIYLIEEKRL